MAKLIRHDSSHAERIRTGNLPVVAQCEGVFELHWARKFSDSSVDLYSSDDSRVNNKTPWGSVQSVRFESMHNKKGQLGDYLIAKNGCNEEVAFKITELKVCVWQF